MHHAQYEDIDTIADRCEHGNAPRSRTNGQSQKEKAVAVVKGERKILVQVKLPESLVKEIDHHAVDWGCYRSDAIQRLLEEALAPYRAQGRLWSSGA
jgi:hypothetical protein